MHSASSITLQSLRRHLTRLAPWVLITLLFASIAHTSHLHKPEALGRNEALHCGLCLQFQRLVAVPSAPVDIAPNLAVERLIAPPLTTLTFQLALSLYDARGPPRG